jgi:hypothetical protein
MSGLIRLGRILLGFGMIALGALAVAYADFILEWTSAPAQLPARAMCAYVHGGVLMVAGLGLFFDRTVRRAALALGAVWLLRTLLWLPRVVANWRAAVGGQFEVLAITSGLFLLAGISGSQSGKPSLALTLMSRYAFAICLPMFGVVHFL